MFKNFILHFKLICRHKYYVGKYCFKAGLYWQGIVHDMSKFSPTEFFESVKYFQGDRNPIDACKEKKGYSMAWLHHKGRNKHHYEYFQDNFDNGGTPIKMPYKYACELICDYLGAGHAYMGDDFTYQKEWEWWQKKKKKRIAMNLQTKNFVNYVLFVLKEGAKFNKYLLREAWINSSVNKAINR